MIFGRIVELVGSVGLFSRRQEVEDSDFACRFSVEIGRVYISLFGIMREMFSHQLTKRSVLDTFLVLSEKSVHLGSFLC